jgi:hypothetical protein
MVGIEPAPPGELDLGRKRLAAGQTYTQLPALGCIGLFCGGYVFDLDLLRKEHLLQGWRRQDSVHVFTQCESLDPSNVKIDILRVADAATEETKVAASLYDKGRLVHPPAELGHENQVEYFDCLSVGPHDETVIHNINKSTLMLLL